MAVEPKAVVKLICCELVPQHRLTVTTIQVVRKLRENCCTFILQYHFFFHWIINIRILYIKISFKTILMIIFIIIFMFVILPDSRMRRRSQMILTHTGHRHHVSNRRNRKCRDFRVWHWSRRYPTSWQCFLETDCHSSLMNETMISPAKLTMMSLLRLAEMASAYHFFRQWKKKKANKPDIIENIAVIIAGNVCVVLRLIVLKTGTKMLKFFRNVDHGSFLMPVRKCKRIMQSCDCKMKTVIQLKVTKLFLNIVFWTH